MVLYMLLYCKQYGMVDCTVWYMELYGKRYGSVVQPKIVHGTLNW